jgi:hypothetical protein
MNTAPSIVAEVRSMDDVREALRARFDALQIARTVIDDAAGLQEGYSAKLLAGLVGFGTTSLFPMIETAGLRLALVDDPAALARTSKLKKRVSAQVRYQAVGKATLKAARPVVLREQGARGGRARMANLSPEEHSEFGRQAVQARWRSDEESQQDGADT